MRSERILLIVACMVGSTYGPTALCQPLWEQLDEGLSTSGPRCFLEDTENDILYVSGAFAMAGEDVISPGIMSWDGEQFSAMACGFNWDCVSPFSAGGLGNGGIVTLAFWNGELYAGGDIDQIDGEPAFNVARWDGMNWVSLGVGLDRSVTRLHGYPDGLYAVGSFTHAGGQEANGLARWDGEQWHSVFDLPLFDDEVNLIYDMAWYNDHIYICGNFGDGNGIRDIAYYDGTAWASVGGGFGGAFSLVNLLEEHNGLLYVAGAFARTQPYGPSDNPGCGIVTWDGTNWGQLGEGTCGSVNPAIYRMVWIQDTLYVTGRFDRIGGVPTGRVGRWDGTRWCSLVPPNYFYPDIGALGAFRDTLLIGGTFWIAGTDSIERVAKWVGGNYTSACGGPTGIDDTGTVVRDLLIFPNPATDHVRIEFPLSTIGEQLVLFDATGRLVDTWRIDRSTMDLDLSHLALGSYAVWTTAGQQARVVLVR
ncbi:MAG: T9SS type A sorting domain-containing protein [Flavobacteriales bacterium]|nr:T9SS type A sorting domain-containing protein [Flavobacteriales bacterium]